jgi:putative DNA primase/helicase
MTPVASFYEIPRSIDMRHAARAYLDAGYRIVPLLPGKKKNYDKEVLDRVYTIDDVNLDSNLALRGTTVVDIDCPFALKRVDGAVLADVFLPNSTRVDGRPGKPRSHRAYDAHIESEPFKDIDQSHSAQVMIVEIISGNKPVVVPPSLWVDEHNPQHQERRSWDDGSIIGPPASSVDPKFLRQCVVYVATTVLIARHWPEKGIRRELRLAYARVLLETLKLKPLDAKLILEWACRLGDCDDNGIKHARRAIDDTKEALDKNEKAIGALTVAKLLPEGDKLIARLREWHGIAADVQQVEFIQASDVPVVKVNWLWHARLAQGAITLVEGGAEKGKSTILVDLAARVSRGHSFPGEHTTREPGNIVMMIAEDDLGATVVPRLMAAGADLTRIYFLSVTKDERGHIVPFHLSDDCERLRIKCQEVGAVFVIVDPLVSYLGSRKGRTLNTYNDMEVRQALAPLKELAERTRASVAAIRHYRKGKGTDAMEAGGGSVAFAALVRVIIAALPDPDVEHRYLLAVAKNNLVAKSKRPAITYEIVPWTDDPDIGRIAWGETVQKSANEILESQAEADQHSSGKVAEAKQLLEILLANGEWIATTDVLRAAEAHGVSKAAVQRAKTSLDIVADRKGNKWGWTLAGPVSGVVIFLSMLCC